MVLNQKKYIVYQNLDNRDDLNHTLFDLNTKLRTDMKIDFEKDLFKLMNNSFFGKTMENVKKCSLNSIKFEKPICAGAVILEFAQTVMYEFHYDFIRKKFSAEDSALCYTDTDSYIYLFKHKIFINIADNITRFNTSGYPENNEHDMLPIERISFSRSKQYE